ncbi:glycosyltransferase family 39 protein [Rhizobiales bacterium]|uniref:ArnT family glycosyltransferase n=1 Tax=Hongsoonwoonella zoysiae TaxID=2821844 RepID=UPI0015619D4D|nr:glycosyltransferase family 39 protein [Hongsoonwoonella zoysiae]NRG19073.1 glycosyltransferase family 39 protein [Hongsoonwoonella zoysiae]
MTDATMPTSDGAKPARDAVKPLWLKVLGLRLLAPAALVVLSLAMTVAGVFQLPALAPGEAEFVEATKQMVETEGYFDPGIQAAMGHNHPPGVHWLQVAAVRTLANGRDAEVWMYRLPSVAAAVLSVLLVYWLARAFAPPQAAFLAGILAALTLLLAAQARLATPDTVLLAAILAAQGALARIWQGEREKRSWAWISIFWLALGLGVLAGGLTMPAVILLTIAALCGVRREVRWLEAVAPLPGLAILLAIVAPMFVGAYLSAGAAAFNDMLSAVLRGGAVSTMPPPVNTLAAFAAFWPLPAFLIFALAGIWRDIRSNEVVFLLCWALPALALLEFTASGFPHGALPVMPPLAVLAGVTLARAQAEPSGRVAGWTAAAVYILPALALAAVSFVVPVTLGLWPSPPGAVLAVFGLIGAGAAARRFAAGNALAAVAPAAVAAVLITAGTYAFTLPEVAPAQFGILFAN